MLEEEDISSGQAPGGESTSRMQVGTSVVAFVFVYVGQQLDGGGTSLAGAHRGSVTGCALEMWWNVISPPWGPCVCLFYR